MNVENANKDFLSLRTKSQWRNWVKSESRSDISARAFSTEYVEDFLKHYATSGSTWAVFQPLSPEPQIEWDKVATDLGLQWAFPKISETASGEPDMQFFKASQFIQNPKYGMLEPDFSSGSMAPVPATELQGVFVPGLVFDNRGFRLGRGKGYYDRFLSDYTGLKVGLCCRDLFVLCPLPKDQWDVRMDYVVTDEFLFKAE